MEITGRPAASRETLYIKILLLSTAFMLLVVFTVFMVAGGASRVGADTTADDTSDTVAPDTSATEIPVGIPEKSYIPVSDASTVAMDPDRLDAGFAALVSLEDNRVIASYYADKRMYPASMTKIMTLIVALEHIDDLDAEFVMTSEIVDAAVAEGASRAGFEPGESVTMRDLLYGASVSSGADATSALAEFTAGSEEDFAVLMNEKAAELGLVSTHFVNASGLHDENHYSTAREIAAIMAYAVENELMRELLSARSYTTSATPEHPRGITLYNTALSNLDSTVFGKLTLTCVKTGYTPEAGTCLASYSVDKDGRGYVLVTASGTNRAQSFADCEYAYTTFIQ